MEVIRGLANLIGSAVGMIADLVNMLVVGPLLNDASYRGGFVSGLVIALVIGWFSNRILFWRGRVLRFFSPTQVPSTDPGPSPSQISAGCGSAILQLVAVVGFVLLVLFVLVRAFVGR